MKFADDTSCSTSCETNFKNDLTSPNCIDAAVPTTLFAFKATYKGETYESKMISCQNTHFDTPDDVTFTHIQDVASVALFSKSMPLIEEVKGMPLNDIVFSSPSAPKDPVVTRRMARSCAPDYNLNRITSHNRFECRYLGVGVNENGKKGRNPFQTWKGTLPSCDDSIEISDELEEDVKKVAYDAAGGDEAKLNIDEFLCNIQSIPIQ